METKDSNSEGSSRPNIVLVLTDDQDVVLSGAQHMPWVHQLLLEEGTVLSNAFVASPLCCPSRSSILTGRYVHNHGALNNSLDGHCSDTFWQNQPEKETVAVHLQAAGYRTFFAGKYLNQYGRAESGGPAHVPPGWDWWLGLVGNSRYYNYSLSVNGTEEKHGQDPDKDYLTTVIERNALKFLDTVPSGDESTDDETSVPFFMMLSTPAAHAPFTPEPQYSSNFSELNAPRTPNFNVENDESKHWLLRFGEQPLREELIDKVDEIFRNRLRTLLTVDDMVKHVIEKLQEKELLDDTYIIFTSDNGFHLAQFSLPYDKRQPYEFDIRVPFVIRGPDIEKGVTLPYATSNVDLAPTILQLASIEVPSYMDGVSLKSVLLNGEGKLETEDEEKADDQSQKNEDSFSFVNRSVLIEHSGEGYAEQTGGCEGLGVGLTGCDPAFDCKCSDSWNSTFSCVRRYHVKVSVTEHGQRVHLPSRGSYQFSGPSFVRDERSAPDSILSTETHVKQKVTLTEEVRLESETEGDVIFCRWSDDENFVEFYDLVQDPSQLHNARDQLDSEQLSYYHKLLDSLVACSGESCLLE
ncbi:Sulfatase N-terminal [Trinorchestia longiramus]|nr:Sulfatase N-terminal [Trinorchestia longiramus]